jgi:hypothetical protein
MNEYVHVYVNVCVCGVRGHHTHTHTHTHTMPGMYGYEATIREENTLIRGGAVTHTYHARHVRVRGDHTRGIIRVQPVLLHARSLDAARFAQVSKETY